MQYGHFLQVCYSMFSEANLEVIEKFYNIMCNSLMKLMMSLNDLSLAAGCKRTPKAELIRMDIVKKVTRSTLEFFMLLLVYNLFKG